MIQMMMMMVMMMVMMMAKMNLVMGTLKLQHLRNVTINFNELHVSDEQDGECKRCIMKHQA